MKSSSLLEEVPSKFPQTVEFFSYLHNFLTREKALSTAAVVPGKQKPFSTNLSMPLTSIACEQKWLKISTHRLSHERSSEPHSSNLAWLRKLFTRTYSLCKVVSSRGSKDPCLETKSIDAWTSGHVGTFFSMSQLKQLRFLKWLSN